MAISFFGYAQKNNSWEEIRKNKEGSITAYWHESKPFIYKDASGQLRGIEFDLLQGFRDYLREQGVVLDIQWQEAPSFSSLYQAVKEKRPDVTFGLSAFSITAARRREVDFSPPYMSDISVLITSANIPILTDVSEFNRMLPKLSAITIEGTTYEQELLRLQKESNLSFDLEYIPSTENIMRSIAQVDSAFGFIDLPVYMMLFNEDPAINVKRQNLLPLKREGYGIIFAKGSDWEQPLAAYFEEPGFKIKLEKVISNYIDIGLYHFVEGLAVHANDNEVKLLTKEKEIQYKDLLGKTDKIMRETRMRNFLVMLVVVIMFFLIIIISLYRKRNEQNEKIELQRQSIEMKSLQLEQRNKHLLELDEEKNNLIKILAHDLRMPINHIQGMAEIMLLENHGLPFEQRALLQQITDSSLRVTKMISRLLDIDALENNRVTASMEEVDIYTLLKKVVNSFQKAALEKNMTLMLAAQDSGLRVSGDPIFLLEIFENLISNAIKFSGPGKEVHVELDQEKSDVIVRVRDEGPGLTAADLERAFKKFQRLSARPTGGEGSVGLGLSIVKKYVKMMGGEVWCESEPNRGATFSVRLRLA
jgi:signal transduction histidine kinase/ABC-type amino acid transport substrate-binding protein